MDEKREYDALVDELVKMRYAVSNGQFNIRFSDISMSEYVTMRELHSADSEGLYEGRTYLKDLADKMGISIKKASKTVGKLKDSGLVVWEHDGDGAEGTYVMLTEDGKNLLLEKESEMYDFSVRVIDRFGKEDMKKMLRLIKEFETVLSTELEKEETEDES